MIKIINILFLISISLYSFELEPLGYKAISMGGTGVASSRGSLSNYYNPALLSFSKYNNELSINNSETIKENNLINKLNKLKIYDINNNIKEIKEHINIGNKDIYNSTNDSSKNNTLENRLIFQNNLDIIRNIEEKNGFEKTKYQSITSEINSLFLIGYFKREDSNIRLNINKDYTKMIFKDEIDGNYYEYFSINENNQLQDIYVLSNELEYIKSSYDFAIKNNINYVEYTKRELEEYPISSAYLIDMKNGILSIGSSIKLMKLKTFYKKYELGEKLGREIMNENILFNEYDYSIGIDIGLAYKQKTSKIIYGLIIKNINNPIFKSKDKDYTINEFVRAGISIPLYNNLLELNIDMDLTTNETLLKNEKSKYMGMGLDYKVNKYINIRSGIMENIEAEYYKRELIYSGGIGLKLKNISIDFSGMTSTSNGQYDKKEIKKYNSLNFSIIYSFGKKDDKKKYIMTLDNTKYKKLKYIE